jgi:antitoxin CcdA
MVKAVLFWTTFLSYLSVLLFGEKKLVQECVTVSTKIPKQLKEKVLRLKIKPSKILRKALEDEVKKREIEELKEEIKKIQPILDKISTQDAVKSIREDRDSR